MAWVQQHHPSPKFRPRLQQLAQVRRLDADRTEVDAPTVNRRVSFQLIQHRHHVLTPLFLVLEKPLPPLNDHHIGPAVGHCLGKALPVKLALINQHPVTRVSNQQGVPLVPVVIRRAANVIVQLLSALARGRAMNSPHTRGARRGGIRVANQVRQGLIGGAVAPKSQTRLVAAHANQEQTVATGRRRHCAHSQLLELNAPGGSIGCHHRRVLMIQVGVALTPVHPLRRANLAVPCQLAEVAWPICLQLQTPQRVPVFLPASHQELPALS